MKTVNIAKGLQLKEVGSKINLLLKSEIVHTWENTPLNELSLYAAACNFKKYVTKKYFKEAYAWQVANCNGDIIDLVLYCKEDTGWKYNKTVSILIDSFNARFVEI